jgi:DNA primase large subunit
MTEPEVEVTVTPAEPEPEPEVVVVNTGSEEGAVEDALAIVEHVEGDTDRWIENATEHAELAARIATLEMREAASAVAEVVEAIAEVEPESEPEPEPENEVEIDIEPVEEIEEHPARAWDEWDAFKEIHNE